MLIKYYQYILYLTFFFFSSRFNNGVACSSCTACRLLARGLCAKLLGRARLWCPFATRW